MRKTLFLYFMAILSIAVIAQSFLVYQSVNEMNGDAKVVNYAGLVRGATQRLVKLEIAGNTNDELVSTLNDYIAALRGTENKYGITFMDDAEFQSTLNDLSASWDLLLSAIYEYRGGNTSSNKLNVISEEHFKLADKAVRDAELCSQGKVSRTVTLILVSSVTAAVMLFFAAISIVSMRDAEKKQSKLISEKNRQLTMANKSQNVFLSNMSHDIRTPLNGIIGMSTIALTNIGNKSKVNDCLVNISESSQYLLNLLNDILDMSKIESGLLELTNEILFIPDVINDVTEITRKQAEAKSQTFDVKIGEITHKYVHGDRLRLSQAYLKVLSNAVKFTPEGGKIEVSALEIAPDKEGCARFLVVVSDNGIGIGEDFIEHVFDSFAREKVSCAETNCGAGLGLPICKNIVSLMNGKLVVESTKDVGTNVTIETEFLTGSQSEVSELEKNPEKLFDGCDFTGRNILVAEDNEMNRQIVSEMLSVTNANVEFALDGRECLNKFASSSENFYSLILMDIQMPVMTGTGATVAIRALNRPDAKTIPIIAMTANVFPEDIKEVIAAGMNSHIAKPFDFNNVKALMNKYMSQNT